MEDIETLPVLTDEAQSVKWLFKTEDLIFCYSVSVTIICLTFSLINCYKAVFSSSLDLFSSDRVTYACDCFCLYEH